ncbi:hypothetical protein N7492_006800 [Penicillium capsulatum]|uniref:Uncharacterized protein n=1 Tax=Penicillium capsulatum TaxID=69766 RepID=A0A9W9HYP4_9EURO|nr:hypothetical protein N7492_006800 [Penicillium capsulatum]
MVNRVSLHRYETGPCLNSRGSTSPRFCVVDVPPHRAGLVHLGKICGAPNFLKTNPGIGTPTGAAAPTPVSPSANRRWRVAPERISCVSSIHTLAMIGSARFSPDPSAAHDQHATLVLRRLFWLARHKLEIHVSIHPELHHEIVDRAVHIHQSLDAELLLHLQILSPRLFHLLERGRDHLAEGGKSGIGPHTAPRRKEELEWFENVITPGIVGRTLDIRGFCRGGLGDLHFGGFGGVAKVKW